MDTTQTTLPVPAYFARSTSTAAIAPIKTQPITSSALPVLMATSYKVALTSVNPPVTPTSSPISAITHASPAILPASPAVDLAHPHARPAYRLYFTLAT